MPILAWFPPGQDPLKKDNLLKSHPNEKLWFRVAEGKKKLDRPCPKCGSL